MPTIAEQMQTLGTKFEPTNGNNSKSNLKSPGGYRVKPAYDALGHYGPRKANEN